MNWETAMLELESAEDFLEFFGIDYAPEVVQVNRLHILKRYHDYLSVAAVAEDAAARRLQYAQLLARAYDDFVNSDARNEKVFRVFGMRRPCSVRVTGP
jgi:nitrogenase-stabilizing/protective protein